MDDGPPASGATTLAAIASMATRRLLAELVRDYERAGGVAVTVETMGGIDAARRAAGTEPFDIVILARQAIDRLANAGVVDAATLTDFARAEIAVGVPAAGSVPSLADEASVRRAVERARAIGYSTGPSGEHIVGVLARFGLDVARDVRLVRAPPGVPVATLIADGVVDLGFQQLPELEDMPGVTVAGVLPESLQSVTTFTAAVTSRSTRREASLRFLAFLHSTATTLAKLRHGLKP